MPYLIDTSGKREEREGPFVKPFLTKSTFWIKPIFQVDVSDDANAFTLFTRLLSNLYSLTLLCYWCENGSSSHLLEAKKRNKENDGQKEITCLTKLSQTMCRTSRVIFPKKFQVSLSIFTLNISHKSNGKPINHFNHWYKTDA